MKKAILTFGVFFTMVVLTSFNEPKTEKVTISKTTTEIGGVTIGNRGIPSN